MTVTTSPQSSNRTVVKYCTHAHGHARCPYRLTVLTVRGVMSPWFLQLEYNRPGFPADIYGFTTEQRFNTRNPPSNTYSHPRLISPPLVSYACPVNKSPRTFASPRLRMTHCVTCTSRGNCDTWKTSMLSRSTHTCSALSGLCSGVSQPLIYGEQVNLSCVWGFWG